MTKQSALSSIAATLVQSRAPRAASTKGKNKPAADKAPTTTETQAQAPAPAPQAAPAPTAPVRPISHAIKDAARPSAGARLMAHTAVFLKHSGMAQGKPVSSKVIREIMGDVAYAYHMRKGNFVSVADQRDPATDALISRGGIALTSQGIALFSSRKPQAELVSAYENVLTRGEPDDRVISNPALVYPIGQ